jgi:hypothetical protein
MTADPYAHLPQIDPATLPSAFPGEADRARTQAALSVERAHHSTARRRLSDRRKAQAATDVLTQLPGPGESLHLLHVGHFDGVDLLVRALELAGHCEHLYVSTLGLNDRTLSALTKAIDDARVGTITLLLSHYFRHVDTGLFNRVHGELGRRGCRVAIARCHAKVWVMSPYVFEGSGNLRSCKSLEQLAIHNDWELADFHSSWIQDLVRVALCENQR